MAIDKFTRRKWLLRVGGISLSGVLTNCVNKQKNQETYKNSTDSQITVQGRILPGDAAPLKSQVFYEPVNEPRHLDISRDIYNSGVAINWGGEPLLRRDINQKLVPALAESWRMGANAEYWDFTIRSGARWSDGVPLTADDWVFTFQHLASPKLDNPWTWFYYDIKGIQNYKEGKAGADEIGVEAIDARTVRIWGEGGAIPHLPALMAYMAAVPAPRHKAETNPEHWADSVEGFVSSGPMRLLNWQHNQRLEWDANPFYNGPHKVGIQRLVQLVGAPAVGWFNSWLNKEIDCITRLEPQELVQVVKDIELEKYLHSFNNFQTSYLSLDCLKSPFDNPLLRRALSHAIDRTPFCEKVMLKTRIPAFSMLPPDFPAHNPELKSVQEFNVEKARALLAEAGYPNGRDADGNQLVLEMYSKGRDVLLEYIKDQWERYLDISVNLQLLESSIWGARRAAHSMPIYVGEYEYDYLDPANLLTRLWKSSSANGSPRHAWKNEQFDELVSLAGREIDESKRLSIYQDAERVLVEDVGGIFLTHMVVHQVWYPYLTGFEEDKTGNTVYRYLDISRFQMYIRNDVADWRN